MNFQIDPKIFELFSDVKIAVILAKGINNSEKDEEILKQLKEKQEEIRNTIQKDDLSEHPKIKPWRESFSKFGAKPKKYRSSIENLYRMTLDGIDLTHINTIVDIYNLISIKHMLPVGGDDLDKIDGDIILTIADGTESFQVLNSEEIASPKEGEVVYKDDKEILCRRWNWRECNKSKMTKETKNVSLIIEALPPTTKEDLENAAKDLQDKIQAVFGIESQLRLLDKEHPSIDL